jgi:catechol 2,3-dioxygenase-like lactoylglutathione lyase family enzyme
MYPIHHIGIFVSDIKRSEEFYSLFGFKREKAMEAGGRKFYMLGNGSTRIELFPARATGGDEHEPGAPGFRHLCFESDDVNGDYERLRKNMEFTRAPFQHENLIIAFCRDPDGIEIELYQQ